MRDMILSLVAEGRTVVLSSHLLDEVERTCDAVAIVDRGKVIRQGPISELLAGASFERAGRMLRPRAGPAPARRHHLRRPRQNGPVGLGDHAAAGAPTATSSPRSTGSSSKAGISVYRLQEIQASLESWFLQVTSRLGEPDDDRTDVGAPAPTPGPDQTRHARPPGLVGPDLGHGHHALHGVAQAARADDRPDRGEHRPPGRLPRRCGSSRTPSTPKSYGPAGGYEHLLAAGGRRHVRLRLRRGGDRSAARRARSTSPRGCSATWW